MNKLKEFNACYSLKNLSEDEMQAIINLTKRYPGIDLIKLSSLFTYDDKNDPDKMSLIKSLLKHKGALIIMAERIAKPLIEQKHSPVRKIKLDSKSLQILHRFGYK